MWCCYVLFSTNPRYPNHTYIGKTNNLTRRLRQHNGEIAGGARATKLKKPHEYLCKICGFETEKQALQYEWSFKHPERKKKHNSKYSGILGRLRAIEYVLLNYPLPDTTNIDIFVHKNYIHLFGLQDGQLCVVESM